MEFNLNWILLGLPLAFGLGWFASRFDLRQLRLENRLTPKAYFKGLNYLLNEQQDKAIDAFIEAVQHDPDTSELHFALGNLFRRRGEYERAVRVHQHLLARSDLSQSDHDRAQYALALDYLKAGLLDRAEDALQKLDGTEHQTQAHLALLSIYERSRDWAKASHIAQQLTKSGQGSFQGRLAHYLCEQAQACSGDTPQVQRLLLQAIEVAPQSARPRIDLAHLYEQTQRASLALETFHQLVQANPAALPLITTDVVRLAQQLHQQSETHAWLQTYYQQFPSLDVLNALIQLSGSHTDAQSTAHVQQLLTQHLQREPSLVAATQWLSSDSQLPEEVKRALDRATKPLQRYRCAACGFEASQHFWQCPGCQAWDSYPARRVEEL